MGKQPRGFAAARNEIIFFIWQTFVLLSGAYFFHLLVGISAFGVLFMLHVVSDKIIHSKSQHK